MRGGFAAKAVLPACDASARSPALSRRIRSPNPIRINARRHADDQQQRKRMNEFAREGAEEGRNRHCGRAAHGRLLIQVEQQSVTIEQA